MASSRSSGANQYGKRPILSSHPELPSIIQEYINTNVLQKDIPEMLESKHGISVSLRTVQKIMKNTQIKTVRRSHLTPSEQGLEILTAGINDPLGRWGCRLMQEKLAKDGVHISRDFIMEFRRVHDPVAVANRHPVTRTRHNSTLWSLGPNEEWCIDGHEKIFLIMGIAIWGINDKFSRKELGLWAVLNARLADVPPALYLRLVCDLGGMPLTTTADKGMELAKLIPLITTLRQMYQPFIDEEILPAHQSVKSVYNITRERGWRPLWEKELSNIRQKYESGKMQAGFHENDLIHAAVSLWLWGAIVQKCLDDYMEENANHRVRKQQKSLLPTGGRRIDFYEQPQEWGGEDYLIKIPKRDIEMLLEEYDKPELLCFGTAEMDSKCQSLYNQVGSPSLKASNGWSIFRQMIVAF